MTGSQTTADSDIGGSSALSPSGFGEGTTTVNDSQGDENTTEDSRSSNVAVEQTQPFAEQPSFTASHPGHHGDRATSGSCSNENVSARNSTATAAEIEANSTCMKDARQRPLGPAETASDVDSRPVSSRSRGRDSAVQEPTADDDSLSGDSENLLSRGVNASGEEGASSEGDPNASLLDSDPSDSEVDV